LLVKKRIISINGDIGVGFTKVPLYYQKTI